ncbi:enoyl-CoA hydratase/isomerase family protein [Asanoa sp. NPDC049573]|uniref:enoyl-CoA hydratase/isomerase family protein n=1 Tax=Asanoa sp. NPDC049573 TaxID=3155396 RepID=UPI003445D8AD
MKDEGTIDLTLTGHLATITISNPPRRNALTPAMWRRLPDLLDAAAADPEVRVLVLTGAGNTFSAGADLTGVQDLVGADGPPTRAEERLAAFPKPTIARVRGYCVGGGCQLAVACDLRIAALDARFAVPPSRLGIVYPGPATRRLLGLVGPAAAKWLLFTADQIDATRAAAIGLADEVVPADELDAHVARLVDTIAQRSQLSIAAAKETIDLAVAGRPSPEREAFWQAEMLRAGDVAEGATAFLERRPADFRWRP